MKKTRAQKIDASVIQRKLERSRLFSEFVEQEYHSFPRKPGLSSVDPQLFREYIIEIYKNIEEDSRRAFKETQNPVFIWLCMANLYELTRAYDAITGGCTAEPKQLNLMLPLSDWVMQYFCDAAVNVEALAMITTIAPRGTAKTAEGDSMPTDIEATITRVLGFVKKGVNLFAQAKKDWRKITIALAADNHTPAKRNEITARYFFALRSPNQLKERSMKKLEENGDFKDKDLTEVLRSRRMIRTRKRAKNFHETK